VEKQPTESFKEKLYILLLRYVFSRVTVVLRLIPHLGYY